MNTLIFRHIKYVLSFLLLWGMTTSYSLANSDGDDVSVFRPEADTIIIPFTLCRAIPMFMVNVNGTSRPFLLDTGAPTVVLNQDFVSSTGESSSVKGVNNVDVETGVAVVEQLEFGGIVYNNIPCMTSPFNDLHSYIYGYIGYEVIKDYDILLDYKKKQLILIRPTYTKQYVAHHSTKAEYVPLQMVSDHVIAVDCQIGQQVYKLGIDSGAEQNLLDINFLTTQRKQVRRVRTTTVMGIGESQMKVGHGILKCQIGSHHFRMPTIFQELDIMRTEWGIDGLIGYPVLSKQRTIISYNSNQLIFLD